MEVDMRGIGTLCCFVLASSSAGCSSDSTDINQPSGRKLAANAISIVLNAQNKGTGAFDPNPLTISLASSTGGTVQWFNDDHTTSSYGSSAVIHNITADAGSFTSNELQAGSSFEATFDSPGTYAYHCSIHPTMKGTVTVTP
jgi:plastocyanin